MREITLGQYYPTASRIHLLDARTKILGTLALVVFTFLTGTFAGLALCAGMVLLTDLLAKIPLRKLLGSLKGIYVLLAFTFVLNLFFYPQGDAWLSFWIIRITRQGVLRALFMALRLILLVTGASLMTMTTSPLELTDGLERMFSPLKKIGFPAHEIAMMMSIALRFIPTLAEETDKIMKAQAARGAVFDKGGLITRAKAVIPLLIPLFVSAFRRAEELAMAMEARCYHGGEGRTRLHVSRFGRGDLVALLVLLLFCGAVIVDRTVLAKALPFLVGQL